MSRRRIEELSRIEFTGSKAVTIYSKLARELCRDLCREFEFSADEFEATMQAAARDGHPLLFGLDVKWKARRVANRLRRAADACAGAAAEVTRFHAAFRKEFATALSPPKKSDRKFDFEND